MNEDVSNLTVTNEAAADDHVNDIANAPDAQEGTVDQAEDDDFDPDKEYFDPD